MSIKNLTFDEAFDGKEGYDKVIKCFSDEN